MAARMFVCATRLSNFASIVGHACGRLFLYQVATVNTMKRSIARAAVTAAGILLASIPISHLETSWVRILLLGITAGLSHYAYTLLERQYDRSRARRQSHEKP